MHCNRGHAPQVATNARSSLPEKRWRPHGVGGLASAAMHPDYLASPLVRMQRDDPSLWSGIHPFSSICIKQDNVLHLQVSSCISQVVPGLRCCQLIFSAVSRELSGMKEHLLLSLKRGPCRVLAQWGASPVVFCSLSVTPFFFQIGSSLCWCTADLSKLTDSWQQFRIIWMWAYDGATSAAGVFRT